MRPSILVIDANPAVQALASAALGKAGAHVEVLGEGDKAWLRISTAKPRVVLCAHDVPGLDAVQLCERIRREKALRQCIFVLLAPSDQRREVVARMQGTVIDKILYKPFKSDQLRQLVENLLHAGAEEQQRFAAIIVEDNFAKRVIEKSLAKRNVAAIHFSTVEAMLHAEHHTFAAVVMDAKHLHDLPTPSPRPLGEIVLLFENEEELLQTPIPPGVSTLGRPLSMKKLEQAFHAFLPAQPTGASEHRPLEVAEQAQLAARVSAVVFERLLTLDAFKSRNWEEAVQALSPEVLRVCKEFKE